MSPGLAAIIGAAGVLAAMSTLGLVMSRRVRSCSDFMVAGRRASAVMVGGVIAGTVVGGGSTIGATELAFVCGWSGAAYAIGASVGCLVLGSLFAVRLRSRDTRTIPQLIGQSYGKSAALASALTSAASVFVTLVAQFIAATSLLTSFFGTSRPLAAALTAFIMLAYVLGGGLLGTAVLGVVKLALLYATLVVSAAVVVWSTPVSGATLLHDAASALAGCARSFMTDVDSVLALCVGMLSTQIYIQSLSAAVTDRAARRGAYFCAALVPPTAVATVLIGGFMRHQFPAIEPVRALPTFIMTFMTPWLAGGMLAVLLVTTIGSGAGLLLGITTTLTRDIALAVWPERLTDRGSLQISRAIMVGVLVVALACVRRI
jgi:solute:Na+ symporter, SSS family